MSSTEQDLKKKLEEDAKRDAQRPKDKDYVEPKDPSGPFGSTKKVDGRTVNELGYKIGSPNGDELRVAVQQDNKSGTTTAKITVSDGSTKIEGSLREQKGKEVGEVVVTHRTNASGSFSGTFGRNNETQTTTVNAEHQKDKDKQNVGAKFAPNGTTIFGEITEDMGKKGTIKAEASSNFKNTLRAGGGYTNNGVGVSFVTEKSQEGWTNNYNAKIVKGRLEFETNIKDGPNKPPEVSIKGTIKVGPEPGKPEPTFWDKPELKSTIGEHTKFCKTRDALSPENKTLYETSLAAVTQAIESGTPPGLSKYKGREIELAVNLALEAKKAGLSQVGAIDTAQGPNGETMLKYGEKTPNKGASLNALEKPPLDALRELSPMPTKAQANDTKTAGGKSETAQLLGIADVAPADMKLYKDSLAATEKALKSGELKIEGDKEQFALNLALRAKQMGMESVADLRVADGKAYIGEKLPVGDPRLSQNDPSYRGVDIDELSKKPGVALSEMQKIEPKSATPEQNQQPNQPQQKPDTPSANAPTETIASRRL